MADDASYRNFDGVEFYSARVHKTKIKAQDEADYWGKDFYRGRFGSKGYPFRYRIIKVKDGWRAYMNNTVHNMNHWERYGKIPRSR
jgi:hypothetical protein